MAQKNSIQVAIDGKVYTLSGYEDIEYLNKVAGYINGKLEDLRKLEGFKLQSREIQNILIYLNVADDYYKAKKCADRISMELEEKERELSELKRELVSLKLQLEDTTTEVDVLNELVLEHEKTIVRLETEAKQREDGSSSK